MDAVLPWALTFTSEPGMVLLTLGESLLYTVGFVVLYVLLLRAMGVEQVTLFNPTTGTMWHLKRRLRKEREHIVVTRVEPLSGRDTPAPT